MGSGSAQQLCALAKVVNILQHYILTSSVHHNHLREHYPSRIASKPSEWLGQNGMVALSVTLSGSLVSLRDPSTHEWISVRSRR